MDGAARRAAKRAGAIQAISAAKESTGGINTSMYGGISSTSSSLSPKLSSSASCAHGSSQRSFCGGFDAGKTELDSSFLWLQRPLLRTPHIVVRC
eukprot:3629458-Rhodomonas_salina.4